VKLVVRSFFLAAALSLALPAAAQTPEATAPAAPVPAAQPAVELAADSACANLTTPAGPAIPDGAEATAAQMREIATLYETWGQARLARLQACRTEYQATRAMADALALAYNASNAELSSITAQFEAEVAEFNAR
jgi:hypothetical protein